MSIELKIIKPPRTGNEPKPKEIYKLKIIKKETEIRVDLTKNEVIDLYDELEKTLEIMT